MAFVGEAVLTAFIETLFDKLASSELLQFARQEQVLADIKKWKRTLLKIHAVRVKCGSTTLEYWLTMWRTSSTTSPLKLWGAS